MQRGSGKARGGGKGVWESFGGWGWGGREWSGKEGEKDGGLVMRVREVARWRVMWFYFQLWAKMM